MAKKKRQSRCRVDVKYRTSVTPESLFHSAQAVLELIEKRGDPSAFHAALNMIEEPDTSSHRVSDLPADRDTIRQLVGALYRKINEELTPWAGFKPLEYNLQQDLREAVQDVRDWCLKNMDRQTRHRLLQEAREQSDGNRPVVPGRSRLHSSRPRNRVDLTDEEWQILAILDDADTLWFPRSILSHWPEKPPSESTVKKMIRRLIDHNPPLLERPRKRKGVRISEAGKTCLGAR